MASDSNMNTGISMNQIEEYYAGIPVRKLVWSPKMDLIAVANRKGDVCLHRLSWHRVWQLHPPRKKTVDGMVWRPDGKTLAIAYSEGEVILVDVESAAVLHTFDVKQTITSLSWTHDKELTDQNQKRYPLDSSSPFLPSVPSINKSYTAASKQLDEGAEDFKKVQHLENLSFLLIGTKDGKLYMYIYGILLCAEIDLSAMLNSKCSVVNAMVTDDLNHISVVVSESQGENCALKIAFLDTSILSCKRHELQVIAKEYGGIMSLMAYLDHTIRAITETWEGILLEMDTKLTSYAKPGVSISADFLDLLMFGMPSPELESFLVHDLTDNGIKKLGSSVQLSYSVAEELVLKNLLGVGQSLAYRLGEVRGLARLQETYEELGLSEKLISDAERTVGTFMEKTLEVRRVVEASSKNFDAFFRWLYVAVLRLNNDPVPTEYMKVNQADLTYTSKFLKELDNIPGDSGNGRPRLYLERFGQYLRDCDLLLPFTTKTPHSLLDLHPVSDHALIFPVAPKKSLVQLHIAVQKAVETAFSNTKNVVCKAIQVITTANLMSLANCSKFKLVQANSPDHKIHVVCLDNTQESSVILYVKLDVMPKNVAVVGAGNFHFKTEEGILPVIDIDFYTSSVLSVLLNDVDDDVPKSVFVQVPLGVLDPHLLPSFDLSTPTKHIQTNIYDFLHPRAKSYLKRFPASCFAVSGTRNVAAVIYCNDRRVRVFEVEAEVDEDDENEEDMDSDKSDADQSLLSEQNISK